MVVSECFDSFIQFLYFLYKVAPKDAPALSVPVISVAEGQLKSPRRAVVSRAAPATKESQRNRQGMGCRSRPYSLGLMVNNG